MRAPGRGRGEDGRRIVELERENRELHHANDLRTAIRFAAAEVDGRLR